MATKKKVTKTRRPAERFWISAKGAVFAELEAMSREEQKETVQAIYEWAEENDLDE